VIPLLRQNWSSCFKRYEKDFQKENKKKLWMDKGKEFYNKKDFGIEL